MIAVEFNGIDLLAQEDEQGVVLVAIKPICEGMGVNVNGQYTKLNNNPKFSRADICTPDARGRKQKMFALPIDQVHTWLSEINAMHCKPQARPAILKYQSECMGSLGSK